MYICKNCNSSNIETKAWINPNDHKVTDKCDDMYDDNDYCWCNDCDDHTTVIKIWDVISVN